MFPTLYYHINGRAVKAWPFVSKAESAAAHAETLADLDPFHGESILEACGVCDVKMYDSAVNMCQHCGASVIAVRRVR